MRDINIRVVRQDGRYRSIGEPDAINEAAAYAVALQRTIQRMCPEALQKAIFSYAEGIKLEDINKRS